MSIWRGAFRPDDIEHDSLSQSARAAAASAVQRLVDVKTTGKEPLEKYLRRLKEGPKPRGRPPGSKTHHDEQHLIEMGRLLATGEAKSVRNAAVIVARSPALARPAGEASVVKRLERGFKANERLYRRLGKEKAARSSAAEGA